MQIRPAFLFAAGVLLSGPALPAARAEDLRGLPQACADLLEGPR